MTIYIENHPFHYELENLCRTFFPNEKIGISDALEKMEDDCFYVYTGKKDVEQGSQLCVRVKYDESKTEKSAFVLNSTSEFENECERTMAILLFELLSQLTGIEPCWGILTGVRPIKLMRRLVAAEGSEQAALDYFMHRLLVSPQKAQLALVTMKAEQKLLSLSGPQSYSLYVSIPFCPSRCSYCSFVSQSVEKSKRLIPEYVRLLCEELKHTAKIAREIGLQLETVYVGGGTPTTLTAQQLTDMITAITQNFDMLSCREFTVEAGRPDTITEEKLAALKQGGVTRISINPQTLNDDVLQIIGRKHTAQQTVDAFRLARAHGFDNINMDLIAGLPGDSYQSFVHTLNGVCDLAPEGITIHTLAMKKSSYLTKQGKELYKEECKTTADMLAFAGAVLPQKEYSPYYLYRQSRMIGNLENVGWAKPGYEGLYNVYIMDETHTVLACGAGAVTKVKEPCGEYLERIFNYKFPYEYNSRFDEMINRKEQVKVFYDKFGKFIP